MNVKKLPMTMGLFLSLGVVPAVASCNLCGCWSWYHPWSCPTWGCQPLTNNDCCLHPGITCTNMVS
jgi:hypothetical protein